MSPQDFFEETSMNKIFAVFTILVALTIEVGAANFFETDFKTFWQKFKTAVEKKDKNAVVEMSRFPVSMPYGAASVKTKAALAKRFAEIFDGEANAEKCFATEKPAKASAKKYEIACGFKKDATGEAGKPIVYSFELTKTGWKFVGLDNINE
jgi:hypothetical protein